MRKVRAYLDIGLGMRQKQTFEFKDSASDEEIDDYVSSWVKEHTISGWNEVLFEKKTAKTTNTLKNFSKWLNEREDEVN